MAGKVNWAGKVNGAAAARGKSVELDLRAEHLAKQMGATAAEEFAKDRLKEQGLENVTKFMGGSATGAGR